MKIVIAPQAFKGSISAMEVSKAIQEGVINVFPDSEIILCPVADGGDGTLETLVESTGGSINETTVTGPIGSPVRALWGAMGDQKTAVIEMARTSGLALLTLDERDPLNATTFGLGEIILSALDAGFRDFIIGIGGSATNDAGAGMAQALGIRLLDKTDTEIPVGGAALQNLRTIDISKLDNRILNSDFQVACDVNNPLTGPEGAAAIYGPQKGASKQQIDILDKALSNLSSIIKKDIGKEVSEIPGAGAAGGLGAGIMAFMDGNLRTGVDIVLDKVGLDSLLDSADLVITGEGGLDFQTVYDKAPIGVAKMAQKKKIPTIAISGMLGKDFHVVHAHGIEAAVSLTNGPMSLEEASDNAYNLIKECAEESLRLISVGMKLNK